MPVHSGIYDLDKPRLVLCRVIHIHYPFRILRPADDKRLTGPAGACPCAVAVHLRYAACGYCPCVGIVKPFFYYVCRAVSRIIPEVIAPEGYNAFNVRIVAARAEVYPLLALIARYYLAVDLNSRFHAEIAWPRPLYACRVKIRQWRGRRLRSLCRHSLCGRHVRLRRAEYGIYNARLSACARGNVFTSIVACVFKQKYAKRKRYYKQHQYNNKLGGNSAPSAAACFHAAINLSLFLSITKRS